jgi:ABC-2 type transport system ATP-binding protein
MTTASDVLAVEVSEGRDVLVDRLSELGLRVRLEGELLLVPLEGEDTYDVILGAVADLDLPLHRLDQRRHRIAELFQSAPQEAAHV